MFTSALRGTSNEIVVTGLNGLGTASCSANARDKPPGTPVTVPAPIAKGESESVQPQIRLATVSRLAVMSTHAGGNSVVSEWSICNDASGTVRDDSSY